MKNLEWVVKTKESKGKHNFQGSSLEEWVCSLMGCSLQKTLMVHPLVSLKICFPSVNSVNCEDRKTSNFQNMTLTLVIIWEFYFQQWFLRFLLQLQFFLNMLPLLIVMKNLMSTMWSKSENIWRIWSITRIQYIN